MNTKIFSGVLSLAIAGAFWACNDDSVITIASANQGAVVESSSSKTKDDSSAKSSSDSDLIIVKMSSSSSAGKTSSSSSSFTYSSSSQLKISSSAGIIIHQEPSSSSTAIVDNPKVSSSSIIVVPVTGLGSCAPTKNPINKGESTTWKFSANISSGQSPMNFISASFAWNFSDNAVPATDATKITSAPVTYATSGVANASVNVTMPDGSYETIQCSPLQVNGDPITGCECTTDATTIDYTAQPTAFWTVMGCSTLSPPLTYVWDEGVISDDAVAAYVFSTAATVTPAVTVHNSDNTSIKVECPAVRATEGPEYAFNLEGDFPSLSDRRIEVPSGSCMSIRGYWNNQYFNGSFRIMCSMNANYTSINSSAVSFLMTYEGKEICSISTAESSYWGFANEGGYIGEMKKGDINYDNICVVFTGAETITCEIGY